MSEDEDAIIPADDYNFENKHAREIKVADTIDELKGKVEQLIKTGNPRFIIQYNYRMQS